MVMPDHWIRRMALEQGMIEPFVETQTRNGVRSPTAYRPTASTMYQRGVITSRSSAGGIVGSNDVQLRQFRGPARAGLYHPA